MKMTQEEEQLVQAKLSEILEKLGISEQEFQMSTMHHGQDREKGIEIMKVQQQFVADNQENPPLSKQKTLETFKKQQEIQMKHMDAMMQGMGAA